MDLAKDKNGRIGRKIPGGGKQAKIVAAVPADERRNLFLSEKTIVADEAREQLEVTKNNAKNQAIAVNKLIKERADRIKAEMAAKQIQKFQKANKHDPESEKLKEYLMNKQSQSETNAVLDSLIRANEPSIAVKNVVTPVKLPKAPADFSSSGANPQYVRGNPMTGGTQWRADFRTQLIVGNPLTRDGVYGPNITDYDRYVRGLDIKQWDTVNMDRRSINDYDFDLPISGGTMVGRYNGQNIPAQVQGMGASLSDIWGGITSGFQQGVSNVAQQLPGQVSTAFTKEIQAMIDKGLARKNPDGTVTVLRETQAPPTIIQQAGVSPTVLLASGLAALGIVAIVLLRR
jgi:hypothetical protein